MNSIRPLRWRDLPLFQRLSKRGLSFDVETSLTKDTGSLRNTFWASLPSEVGGTPTYILRYNGQAAIGQLRHPPNTRQARIAFAAPVPQQEEDQPLWEALLDELSKVAGESGATSLIVELAEDLLAFEGLRRAGYSVYARQEIWMREPAPLEESPACDLYPFRSSDEIGASQLYHMIVPGILQQVENVPPLADSYILKESGTIVGLISSKRGSRGVLLQAHLHPDAEQRTDEALGNVLHYVRADKQPVYFRVRRYQGWQGKYLEKFGFKVMGTQAVMVKHIAVRIGRDAFRPLPHIRSGAKITTPTPSVTTDFMRQAGGMQRTFPTK